MLNPFGILECWNNGIVGNAKQIFLDPIFHHSIIPFFHD